MSSYDRMDDVLYFCSLTHDYERIVAHHVQSRDCAAALQVLALREVCAGVVA